MRVDQLSRWKGYLWAILLSLTTPAVVAEATADHMGFFDVYQQNREQDTANYITEDFLLLAYSMIRQQALADMEEKKLLPLWQKLLAKLDKAIESDSKDPAAVANQDFIAVLNALLADKKTLDSKRAQAELKLILDAQGIAASPLWDMSIDYSQFKPRGRYTETPELAAYFRAVRYANTVLFAIKESDATSVSTAMADRMAAQALALAKLLHEDKQIAPLYKELNEQLVWQFGPSNDLTSRDLLTVVKKTDAKDMAAVRKALLKYAQNHQRQPRILSGVVDASKLEEGTEPKDVLTGWRLMPSRYSPDSAAFQQLLYDQVGTYINDCSDCQPPFGLAVIEGKPVKGFPMGLELMALLGSASAHEAVQTERQNRFEGYEEAFQKASQELANASGLAKDHMLLMRTWLSNGENPNNPENPDNANDAKNHNRHLNSMLAFWTWQRYLELLYSKQPYTPSGKSLQVSKARTGAWLEPAVELYLALSHVAANQGQMTEHPAWKPFEAILQRCLAISFRELQENPLSAKDQGFLNNLDQQLLKLTKNKDQPIVVDIHTNPASQEVVQEGIGFARVVSQDKARGALFTHYEFKQPLQERLDNDQWLTQLRSGKQP
jgi:hypothetical protein